MNTKPLANEIVRHHATRDPFCLAESLGFIVIRTPLIGTRGLQQRAKRQTILYVNVDLDEQQQRLVCAHELGHYFMHRGMNRLFMDRGTRMVSNKFEQEANRFAVDFLYDDRDLFECTDWSLTQLSAWMGVPQDLAAYRMSSL